MSSGPAIPPHAEHEPREDAAGTSGAAVLRGGIWNLVGLFVPQLALLAVSIAAARYLGRDQFGRQSFIAFVEVTTLTLCAAGLPLALARFAGDAVGRGEQGVVRSLARWVARMTVVLGLAGAGVLAGIGLAGATPRAAWLLAASVVLLGTVQRIPSAVLNGLQLWRGPSLVGVVMAVAMAVAGILVLAAGGGIVGMFAVEAAAAVVSLAWLWLVSRRAQVPLGPPVPVEPPLKHEFLRYAFVASLGVVLTLIVWRRSEFLFLNHYSSDSEIALYSVAFSAVAALLLIPQALVGVVLPAVANLLGAGATDRIRWGFERAIRLLLAPDSADDGGLDRARSPDAAACLRGELRRCRHSRDRAPRSDSARHPDQPEQGRARRHGPAVVPAQHGRHRSRGERRAGLPARSPGTRRSEQRSRTAAGSSFPVCPSSSTPGGGSVSGNGHLRPWRERCLSRSGQVCPAGWRSAGSAGPSAP